MTNPVAPLRSRLPLLAVIGLLVSLRAGPLPAEREWADRVAPLLDRHCFKCHGGVRQRGGLDLRSMEQILKGGESGPAIVPGRPEESHLCEFVHAESDPHMPPKKQLEDSDIAILRQWVSALPRVESLGLDRSNPSWSEKYMAALSKTRQTAYSPPPGAPASEVIDRFIELGWRERNLRPAEPAPDQAFARRLYLDLAGRIPTLAELDEFLEDPRRDRLVDRLLAGEDYPRRMREVFDVVLMERRGARAESRRKENQWFEFLESSFRSNRPWNEMVREMILARPGGTNRGAAWYLYERRDNYQAMAEAVAPLAFGVQIGCAQCHNHPLAWEIEQRHYWGLVAAFNRGKNVESAEGIGIAESAIGGFVTFNNLKKESQPALLAFLNGVVIDEKRPAAGEKEQDLPELYRVPPPREKEKPQKPAVPKFSRREALANAATADNPALARAFVNRIWAMLLGRGLVHPVDQIDSRHFPSHPDLFDWLARDFEQSGYDVKRLVRQIVLSRVYQLDSRSTAAGNPPPEAFARALEKPLSAEQLFHSFLVAAGARIDSEGNIAGRPEAEARSAFIDRFPELFPEEYNASLQQATFISNSTLIDSLLSRATGNTTDELLALESMEARVAHAFRVVLGREVQADELPRARALLERRPGESGIKHLLWALIASAEFQLNH